MRLPNMTQVLSVSLGGCILILVAADLVSLKKMTRRQIGLLLAFGAAFTAIGLLGLLGFLASALVGVSFTTVMAIMFTIEATGRFYPAGVRESPSRLFILCALFFSLDFCYRILTILQG